MLPSIRLFRKRTPGAAQSRESGFTLLEMLVAIILMALLASVIFPLFSESLRFSQADTTHARLRELVKGLQVAYRKDAMVIDSTGANGAIVFTAYWTQLLGNAINTNPLTNGSETVTPSQAYPLGQPQQIQSGFDAIAGASGNSPVHLATDGYGHPIWIYVSPEMEATYDGYPLYYHDAAFLSTNGAPASVSPQSQGVTYTCTVNPANGQSGCSLNLGTNGGQHDIAVTFSGYAVEAAMYKQTLSQMNTVANAYGAYFTTQYLANPQRNTDIDYFANIDTAWDGCGPNGQGGNAYMDTNSAIPNSGDGSNGGPGYWFPGENPDNTTVSFYGLGGFLNDVQPVTWDNEAFVVNLGISLSEAVTAWGFQMGVGNGPNAPSYDNVLDRDPLSCTANLQSPPYTADIVAWAPYAILLDVPVVGAY